MVSAMTCRMAVLSDRDATFLIPRYTRTRRPLPRCLIARPPRAQVRIEGRLEPSRLVATTSLGNTYEIDFVMARCPETRATFINRVGQQAFDN